MKTDAAVPHHDLLQSYSSSSGKKVVLCIDILVIKSNDPVPNFQTHEVNFTSHANSNIDMGLDLMSHLEAVECADVGSAVSQAVWIQQMKGPVA